MGARLHRHEERRTARAVAGFLQRDDLGVSAAVRLRHPRADDASFTDDDGPNGRIGIGDTEGVLGELQCAFEAHATEATSRR